MKITYSIELDNGLIGVEGTVARVEIDDGFNHDEMAFLLKTEVDDGIEPRSVDAALALIETVTRIAKCEVKDLVRKETTRRKTKDA